MFYSELPNSGGTRPAVEISTIPSMIASHCGKVTCSECFECLPYLRRCDLRVIAGISYLLCEFWRSAES